MNEELIFKFRSLPYPQQIMVIQEGRPKPELNIEATGCSRGKTFKRVFNKNIYLRNRWIFGSTQKNALFCFPCVLFSGNRIEKPWTELGVQDLAHLSDKIKKHENSKAHLNNELRFALFGKVNVQEQLDSAYWRNIQKHNQEVTKNRYVLSKIVNCIKFCGAFELALRGQDQSEASPGIFSGLINFASELDKTLQEHLQNATIFKGTSKTIQNDILDCMLQVCHEEIIEEVNEAPFLAVIADETTDISSKFQLATILRYTTRDGDPVERFWNFLLPPKHDAETLSETILSVIDPMLGNDSLKLIAQSYDGASVMGGEHGGVHNQIKEKYSNAYFVHCYAHQLNLVISRACSINPQVRVFFGFLNDIPLFFNNSSQRLTVLNEIVGRNMPQSVPNRWNFNNTVNVVYNYKESIIECMEHFEETCNTLTGKQAAGVRLSLENPVFIFWLTFFHNVMPHIDILHNQLEKKSTNPAKVQEVINIFEENINSVRSKIDSIIEEASDFATDFNELQKRRRPNNSEKDHRVAATEVCDVIINNVKERFASTGHLLAASLLCSENFVEYFNRFPENELDLTCAAYNIFNKNRLKTELSVLYSNRECRALRGAVPFLKFIISNNLAETMTETKKLLEILLTTPMTTDEAERSFSTLKRIKTFLKNTMCDDRLTALSMLSIEKNFISTITNFNDRVIDKFAANKDPRIALQYKRNQ